MLGLSGSPLRPSGKVLQGDARRHHRALVLQHLFRGGPASRADLARRTELTRVTVSDLVADLIDDGLVRELGSTIVGRIGKPPTLVGLDSDAAHIIAIDLSPDDHMAGAVVNLVGQVRARAESPLDGARGDSAETVVRNLAAELMSRAGRPVLGIGLGSPGVVDGEGVVLDAPNLGWQGVPLAENLRNAFDVPVHVANDANAAVLGEHTFGDAAGDTGLMCVRIGTGVGAGLILEGALMRGHRRAAGEIGHIVVDPSGALCACGRRGCLETVLAVPRLRVGAAQCEDPKRLQEAGKWLGSVLAPVVAVLNLQELVLSGPPDVIGAILLRGTAKSIRCRAMSHTVDDLVVRASLLGNDSVIVGASVLVLAAELGFS